MLFLKIKVWFLTSFFRTEDLMVSLVYKINNKSITEYAKFLYEVRMKHRGSSLEDIIVKHKREIMEKTLGQVIDALEYA